MSVDTQQPSYSISMIICTFNRRQLVAKLIDSALQQPLTDIPFEIVVVDNNSSDDTADYLQALASKNEFVRYVFEPRQGLSNARNAGADAARHDFLVFIDDDAVLSPNYVSNLVAAIRTHDPDMFGGPIYPDYVDAKPAWFPESLEIRKKTETSGFSSGVTLSGGNIGIRRSLLSRLGGFNPEYGMTGNKVGMLEERLLVETYRRVTPASEQRVYYCLESFILHRTPASRMTVGFQVKRIWLANYLYIGHSLEKGVRRSDSLGAMLRRRFIKDGLHLTRQLVKQWRNRHQAPDAPMKTLISLLYRAADWAAYVNFALFQRRGVERVVRTRPVEDRPLNILLLTHGKRDERSLAVEERGVSALSECLGRRDNVDVESIHGMANDQIRNLVHEKNIRWCDVIITDSAKAVTTLSAAVRPHFPHVQIIYSVPWPDLFYFSDNRPGNDGGMISLIKHKDEFRTRMRRDRDAFRAADQVIISTDAATKWYAKFLMSARHLKQIPAVFAQEHLAVSSTERRLMIPHYCIAIPQEKRIVHLSGKLSAIAGKNGWTTAIVGKLAKSVQGGAAVERLGSSEYWHEMHRASVILIPAPMRWRGTETVIDALALGKPVVVAAKMLSRLPPALRRFCVAYDPQRPETLLPALEKASTDDTPPEQRREAVEVLRAAMAEGWRDVIGEARIWAPRRLIDNNIPTS